MKALVTGGGGFLGSAIIHKLIEAKNQVSSFSRGIYPSLQKIGVNLIRGDISDKKEVTSASKGCDIIFHVAAKPGIWGPYSEYYKTNVTGTENVIEACRVNRIKYLVYTSSPSVIFNGNDMEGIDESVPYPDNYEAHYPKTKALAEQLVLKANSSSLSTVSIRPHLIWGPGDNHLIPRVVSRGKSKKLRKIGSKPNLIDTTYIDNAVEAHILAAKKLFEKAPIGGKTYFISNGEPIPMWDFINRVLNIAGLPDVTQTISPRTAYSAGWILEKIYKTFNIKKEPRMTCFLAKELSTAHWFNIDAARKELGYKPLITIDEGFKQLMREGDGGNL